LSSVWVFFGGFFLGGGGGVEGTQHGMEPMPCQGGDGQNRRQSRADNEIQDTVKFAAPASKLVGLRAELR